MKRLQIAPYGCQLHITDNFAEWNKTYARWGGEELEEGSAGLTVDNRDGNYLVGVFSGGIPTLAHELGHVCLDITERVGLGNIVKEQEAFCYLLGHLTKLSLNALPQIKDQ